MVRTPEPLIVAVRRKVRVTDTGANVCIPARTDKTTKSEGESSGTVTSDDRAGAHLKSAQVPRRNEREHRPRRESKRKTDRTLTCPSTINPKVAKARPRGRELRRRSSAIPTLFRPSMIPTRIRREEVKARLRRSLGSLARKHSPKLPERCPPCRLSSARTRCHSTTSGKHYGLARRHCFLLLLLGRRQLPGRLKELTVWPWWTCQETIMRACSQQMDLSSGRARPDPC